MTNDKQRERLVELLEEADKKVQEYILENDHMDWIPKSKELSEVRADFLLANGVIVPPCKVGQTLYLVRQDVQKIIEVIVIAIIQRNTFQYAEVDIVEDNRKSLITLAYWGDRLFPTKEEAEEALGGV